MVESLDELGESILAGLMSEAKVLVTSPVAVKGLLRKPYDNQLRSIRGVEAVWNVTSRVAILNADTGTGKTLMGSVCAYLLAQGTRLTNVVISAPPTLTDKWEREIRKTVPVARVTQCLGSTAQAQLRRGLEYAVDGLHVFIVADTTVRRHYHSEKQPLAIKRSDRLAELLDYQLFKSNRKFEHGVTTNPCTNDPDDAGHIARCPRCGTPFTKESGKEDKKTFKYLTVQQMERKTQMVCTNKDKASGRVCGEVWRVPVKTVEVTKVNEEDEEELLSRPDQMAREVSLAYWAKKRARKQEMIDLVIIDEAHRAKNNGIHGETLRWLATAGKKVLLLTGTLTGGYARDLFYLLFMANPKGMRAAGFDYSSFASFCEKYGAEEVKHLERKDGKFERRPRMLPGISANVYPDFLMDRTLFLSLKDLEIEMPKLREYLEVIPITNPDMRESYDRLVKHFKMEMERLIKIHGRGNAEISSMVGKAMAVWASWPDSLRADEISGNVAKEEVKVEVNDLELELTDKEARLVEIITKNRDEGRKCLVYVNYTGKRDCAGRMEAVLRAHGIFAVTLRDRVSANKREAWIAERVSEGIDAMICNAELVKEGYDLIDFPTIISTQPMLNLFTHRQSMARAYRPGQTKEVRHHFLAYQDTVQESLLALVASKLDSALLAEGNLQESALLEISYSQDSILREMIKAVIDGNENLLKVTPTVVVYDDEEEDVLEAPVTEEEIVERQILVEYEGVPILVPVISRRIVGRKSRVPKGLYHPDQLSLFEFVAYEEELPIAA
jgi:superfamily II DNA or RNA helicase